MTVPNVIDNGAVGGGGGGGAQGPQGAQGVQGPQGRQGPQGAQGNQGLEGSQGIQGAQGPQGSVGGQGTQGAQGAQGYQGESGPQGSLPMGAPAFWMRDTQIVLNTLTETEMPNPITGSTTLPAGTWSTDASDLFPKFQHFSWKGRYWSTNPAGTLTLRIYLDTTECINLPVTLPNSVIGQAVDIDCYLHNTNYGASGQLQGLLRWTASDSTGVVSIVSTTDFNFGRTFDFTATNVFKFTVQFGTQHADNRLYLTDYSVFDSPLLGPQGESGIQGAQGPQGLLGVQGSQGAQGWQGWQGNQGVQGFQGYQGPQGDQGPQGVQGWQGGGGQGPQGPQGGQGAQGNVSTGMEYFTSTVETTVASSDTENTLIPTVHGSTTIPAATFNDYVGKQLVFEAWGWYSSKASGPGTATLRVKLDANHFFDLVWNLDTSVVNQPWHVKATFNTTVTGGTGEINCTGYADISDDAGLVTSYRNDVTVSALDLTTYAPVMDCTIQFSLSDAANSITCAVGAICYSEQIGVRGYQGPQGRQGAQGAQGWQGAEGAPTLVWSFPGTLSTDQNGNIPRWNEQVGRNLAAFDVNVITAPTGADLIVNFQVNGATVAVVTVTAGTTYAATVAAVTLNIGDLIYPEVAQVGTLVPGTTAMFRARQV